MSISMRWYQSEAVDAMCSFSGTGGIVALPTGAGKSIVIAEFIRRMREQGKSVINAIHVGELVRQNAAAIERHCGERVSVLSASVGRKDAPSPITVCGVGTAYRSPMLGRYDICLIDECHLVSGKGGAMYSTLLSRLQKANPGLQLIGLTATPWRMDGPLTEVSGGLWTEVIYDACTTESFGKMVSNGYLSPLIKGSSVVVDFSSAARSGGQDYSETIMGHKLEPIIGGLLQKALSQAQGRRKILVYLPTVKTCQMATDHLRGQGVWARFVTGSTPKAERESIIRTVREHKGEDQMWLCSVSALTTGLDIPDVDALVILRATKSSSLHVQILGRGTRVAPGKTDCLVIDMAGNTERCGPIDNPIIPAPKVGRGSGESVKKECPHCGNMVHASVRMCPHCGMPIPVSTGGTVLSGTVPPMAGKARRLADMGDAIQSIMPSTTSSAVVMDKSGRTYCRLSWGELSCLVTPVMARAAGIPAGMDAHDMAQWVSNNGTKPFTGSVSNLSSKYAKVSVHKGTPSRKDAWWPVTCSPATRAEFIARVLDPGGAFNKGTITRAEGVGHGMGGLAAMMADTAREMVQKKMGAVTEETVSQWIISLVSD